MSAKEIAMEAPQAPEDVSLERIVEACHYRRPLRLARGLIATGDIVPHRSWNKSRPHGFQVVWAARPSDLETILQDIAVSRRADKGQVNRPAPGISQSHLKTLLPARFGLFRHFFFILPVNQPPHRNDSCTRIGCRRVRICGRCCAYQPYCPALTLARRF